MTNPIGASMLLNDLAGTIQSSGQNKILCVAIKSALAGSLTISGLTTGNGVLAPVFDRLMSNDPNRINPNLPSDWVIPPGSSGAAFTHPGNGRTGGGALWYSYSNPSDQGKVVIAFGNTA